ncbi:MAG TPA: hypothetical protein VNO30_28180 [Kofleriaceae bacterium]|nr:hypothetical protein [Kofleriaceae bacterium]
MASIPTGQIVRVDDGATTPVELVAAGTLGQSAVGMQVSRSDDLLWICDGTYGTDLPPSVIGIDPDTGAERVRHHFPAQRDGRTGGLCNEIAEDAAARGAGRPPDRARGARHRGGAGRGRGLAN